MSQKKRPSMEPISTRRRGNFLNIQIAYNTIQDYDCTEVILRDFGRLEPGPYINKDIRKTPDRVIKPKIYCIVFTKLRTETKNKVADTNQMTNSRQ